MRLIAILLLTLGGVLCVFSVVAWRADRSYLANWHRATARVDSVRVVDVPLQLPYTLGGHGAGLALTYELEGRTYRGLFANPAWARRSYLAARRDAREALDRGSIEILIDPADHYHLSMRPAEPLYYYRDAWQLALLGIIALAAGEMLRRRSPATA